MKGDGTTGEQADPGALRVAEDGEVGGEAAGAEFEGEGVMGNCFMGRPERKRIATVAS